jgi:large subunit ribosomal protein L9
MEVILKEDVQKLGHRGDVVKVAAGYGRNYLLPTKLAIEATTANKAVIQQMKASAIRKSAGEKDGAVAFGEQLNAAVVLFERKTSPTGQLFGSVTSADIAKALEEQGFTVDKRKIHLDEPLKTVGEYHVPVRIHREVTAHVQVTIKSDAPEGAEAQVEDTDTGFVSLYTGELDDNRD